MIRAAYERYLLREVPADALRYHINELAEGLSHRALVRKLAAAPEHLYKLGAGIDSAN
jgi:hypothetical protein